MMLLHVSCLQAQGLHPSAYYMLPAHITASELSTQHRRRPWPQIRQPLKQRTPSSSMLCGHTSRLMGAISGTQHAPWEETAASQSAHGLVSMRGQEAVVSPPGCQRDRRGAVRTMRHAGAAAMAQPPVAAMGAGGCDGSARWRRQNRTPTGAIATDARAKSCERKVLRCQHAADCCSALIASC